MTKEQHTPDETRIILAADEALVLFALLSRWSEPGESPTPDAAHFNNPAECAVLHGLLSDLERQLVAPLEADYAERVRQARSRLQDGWNGATLRG